MRARGAVHVLAAFLFACVCVPSPQELMAQVPPPDDAADVACQRWADDAQAEGNARRAWDLGCRPAKDGRWVLPRELADSRLDWASQWTGVPACGLMPDVVCASVVDRTRPLARGIGAAVVQLSIAAPPDLETMMTELARGERAREASGAGAGELGTAYREFLGEYLGEPNRDLIAAYIGFWVDARASAMECGGLTATACEDYYGPERDPWPWELLDGYNQAYFVQAVVETCLAPEVPPSQCEAILDA
jgi:hypothetical protein